MKRSEYVREVLEQAKVPGAWFVVPFGSINQLPVGVHTAELLAERLADLQSAAGVVWDPEEPKLADEISCGIGGGALLARVRNDQLTGVWFRLDHEGGAPFDARATTLEAVRRYNAWPELEKLVERLEAWAAGKIWVVEERRYMEAAVRALREFLAERKAC